MRLALTLALMITPSIAFAAGGTSTFTPPAPTPTTEECEDGTVWDEETESCVAPEDTTNDEAALIDNARELAYAGRYDDTLAVLDRLDPADPWVLTYRGFVARKTGDMTAALAYYQDALDIDPDNLLARSYMGQGLVVDGRFAAAEAELDEIIARGGAGTWPEVALRTALETGEGYDY